MLELPLEDDYGNPEDVIFHEVKLSSYIALANLQ